MLTCTVSMVESAIAILATCLPALRSMILGTNNTSKGNSNTYGKHYELSSPRRKAKENRLTIAGHISSHDTRHRANGSEDSLFIDKPTLVLGQAPSKITVNTQIETMFENSRSTSESAKTKNSPF